MADLVQIVKKLHSLYTVRGHYLQAIAVDTQFVTNDVLDYCVQHRIRREQLASHKHGDAEVLCKIVKEQVNKLLYSIRDIADCKKLWSLAVHEAFCYPAFLLTLAADCR